MRTKQRLQAPPIALRRALLRLSTSVMSDKGALLDGAMWSARAAACCPSVSITAEVLGSSCSIVLARVKVRGLQLRLVPQAVRTTRHGSAVLALVLTIACRRFSHEPVILRSPCKYHAPCKHAQLILSRCGLRAAVLGRNAAFPGLPPTN